MTRVAAAIGAVAGAVLFAPAFCVTQHDDPGGTSTRCQALVHLWMPSLAEGFAPGGWAGVAFFVAGVSAVAAAFWFVAALWRKGRGRRT